MLQCLWRNQQLLAATLQQRSTSKPTCGPACRALPEAPFLGGGAPHGSAPPADARARPATATPTIDPKLLTSQIKRCTSLRALQQLHLQHAGTLNHIHASALLTHAAQISASSSHAPRQQGQQGGAHGAAAATREPATAPTQPLHSQEALQQWVLAVAADLGCCLGDCGSRELSISLWALAKLGVQPPSSWLERALAALQGRMHQAGSQDLANALWALAALQQPPNEPWMQPFWQRCQQLLEAGACSAAEVASLSHSAGALRLQPPPAWARALVRACGALWGDMRPQGYSNLLWGLARLQQAPDAAWLAQCCNRMLPLLPAFSDQQLSNTLWALAALGRQPPGRWLGAFVAAARRQLPHMAPQALANTAAALHVLLQRPQALPLAAAGESSDASGAGGAGEEGGLQRHLLLQLLWDVQCAAGDMASPGGGGALLNRRDACALAWSAASLPGGQGALVPAAAVASSSSGAGGGGSSDAGSDGSPAARLPWADQYLAAQRAQLAQAAPSELVELLWVAARACACPGAAWLGDYCAAAAQRLPACTPAQLAQLAWAAAQLQRDAGAAHPAATAFAAARQRAAPAGVLTPAFGDALLRRLQGSLGVLPAHELVAVAAGAGWLAAAHPLPEGFAVGVVEAAAAQLPHLQPPQLLVLVRAVARMSWGQLARQPQGGLVQASPGTAATTGMSEAGPVTRGTQGLGAASRRRRGDRPGVAKRPAAPQAAEQGAPLPAAQPPPSPQLEQLLAAAAAAAGALPSGDACQLAWALASLGHQPSSAVAQQLVAHALQQPAQLRHRELCAALRAVGHWQCCLPGHEWQRLAAAPPMGEATPRQVAMLLSLLGPLDRQPGARDWAGQLWRRLQQQLRGGGEANGAALAALDVLWLLGWLRVRVPRDWIQEALYELEPHLQACSLLQLHQAAHMLLLLRVPPGGARDTFVRQLLASAAAHFSPRSAASSDGGGSGGGSADSAGEGACSSTTSGAHGGGAAAALEADAPAAPAAATAAAAAEPHLLAALLLDAARLQAAPPAAWMDACVAALAAHSEAATAGDVCRVLLALAALQYRPEEAQLEALLARACALLSSMTPAQLASSLHALSKLRVAPPSEWMDAFYATTGAPAARQALGVHFVTLVWALAKMGDSIPAPDPAWLQSLLEASTEGAALTQWTPQQLANTVCAFARLGFNPGQEWLASFGAAVGAQAGAGALQQLDHFHIQWAWRELNESFAVGAAMGASGERAAAP